MASSTEEKIQAEMLEAKEMKISELKMKLMSRGVLTSTFLEKDDFVRAYAEAVVRESESGVSAGLSGLATPSGGADDDDDEEDDEDEDRHGEAITRGLPPYMKLRVEKLREIHAKREELLKEYLAERAAMEAKYQELSKPLFEQRERVVGGEMDEEIAAAATEEERTTAASGEKQQEEETIEQGIPQFWACAIHQMPVTEGIVSEHDIECLGFLRDIRCLNHDNGEGFVLEFHFAPNDFFENLVLTKSYDVPNLLLADEPILKNVRGCEIRWKPNKSLVSGEVTRQQRGTGKNAGQVRTVTKTTRRESFFHFFTPPEMTDIMTMTEEDALRIESAFDEDYDVAQAFRSHIIPRAVEWFAGDAMEKEMEAAMEGMEWPDGVKPSGL